MHRRVVFGGPVAGVGEAYVLVVYGHAKMQVSW